MSPPKLHQAIIFDFDGVIVDSEKYWRVVEAEHIKALAPDWKLADADALMGKSATDNYTYLVEKWGLTMSFQEFMASVAVMEQEVYTQCELIAGVTALVDRAHEQTEAVGIASSSNLSSITSVLDRYAIRDRFHVITTAEEVEPGKGKPFPDIYLLAAHKMKIDPSDCIVIEDSHYGVTAAKAAGMYVIGFRNGMNEEQDLSAADEVVTTLTSISFA